MMTAGSSQEIEFSIMGDYATALQPQLEQFEAEYHLHVRLRPLSWDTAWSTLVKAALYNDGPDVSEMGSTWLSDLVGMNALRSFNAADVAACGKASAYLPLAWKSVTQYDEPHVWGIPWLVGSRLLYYRRSLLARAGLDPQMVFHSNAALEAAVQRLQAVGVQYPWTVPTGSTHTTLLNAASWVWAEGGDFIRADGKATRFTEPEALSGLRAYFSLGKYLAPEVRGLNGLEPDEWFLSHPDTGMTVSGPWLFCAAQARARQAAPFDFNDLGVVLPPGPSFVGGSSLVIWKYSRQAENAVKLVRFLTQPAAQVAYSQQVGLLPARLDALASPPFASDPFWQTAVAGLKSGRTFPTIRLWGLVEDRLAAAFSAVWAHVLADPGVDLAALLTQHLEPIAQRLDHLLVR